MKMIESISDMTPHQQQKRNQNLNKRRKGKRVKNSLNSFTTAVPPPGSQTIQRNVDHLDLFPAITQDFCQRISEYKRLLADYENDPNNLQKPPKVNDGPLCYTTLFGHYLLA
jgi:hypothetical protein